MLHENVGYLGGTIPVVIPEHQDSLYWPEYGEESGGWDWFSPATDFSSEFRYDGNLSDFQNSIVVDVDTDANGVMSHFQVHKIENLTMTVVTGEDTGNGSFTMAIHSQAVINNKIVQGPSGVLTVDANWLDMKTVYPDGTVVTNAHVRTNLVKMIR